MAQSSEPYIAPELGPTLAAALAAAQAAEARGESVAAQRGYVEVLLAQADHTLARQRLAALDAAMTRTYQALTPPHAPLSQMFAIYQAGRLPEAQEAAMALLANYPQSHFLHCLIGIIQSRTGRTEAALASFHAALAIKPDYAEAHFNLACAYEDFGRQEEALGFYLRALALVPDNPEWLKQLGSLYALRGYHRDAIALCQRALALKPDLAEAQALLLSQMLHIADWRAQGELATVCARLSAHPAPVTPFVFLPMTDDAEVQLRFSRKWAAEISTPGAAPLPAQPRARGGPLRIGYFSADFRDHATMHLMAGLLREHDRTRFEVHAYSYGSQAADDRARTSVAHFFDVSRDSSRDIADLARSHALDIAIDLKGYTTFGRTDLFQYRPAPVQIGYLGYPGSSGAGFIDYLVADRVVIPADQRAWYSEQVIWLPHSYQPNDKARAIAGISTTRAGCGLPDSGFVFCCFNNTYKIGPREFDIWMRLLGRIEGSVLWLFRANRWAEDNLRQHAAARGIAPERLVFADRLDQAHHLARHCHADLFLDTFNVNAHTTASDALWAGLPVVTKAGRQFAARVSASLLTAIGLPDLITETGEAYEALALALASDPARLADIRARLAANRLDHPLFDTVRYTRNFEAGLQSAYENHRAGLPPHDIDIRL